jgi:hypothetical protein
VVNKYNTMLAKGFKLLCTLTFLYTFWRLALLTPFVAEYMFGCIVFSLLRDVRMHVRYYLFLLALAGVALRYVFDDA